MSELGFEKVYPFATENVKGYMEKMDLKGKNVLTVGSSMDQVLNAITLGAKKITLLDINPYCYDFFQLKKKVILQKDRRDVYSAIVNPDKLRKVLGEKEFFEEMEITKDRFDRRAVYRINQYLSDDKSYDYLRKRLKEVDVRFVTGDIFKMEEVMRANDKFDAIVLSNILQYLEYFYPKGSERILRDSFGKWIGYLRDGGILQLLYLYDFKRRDVLGNSNPLLVYDLRKVYEILREYVRGHEFQIEWIGNSVNPSLEDAVVTYRK